jgi:uncharacterized protein
MTSLNDEQTTQVVKQLASTFRQMRSPILHKPDEYGLEYEEVFFPSMDGVPLEGWFMPREGSDKLVIANHPLWFNRYGFAAHLDPWKQIGAAGGNDFEVNYVPDYKNLHDAGYNVLAYDMRNHGHSSSAHGGIATNGLFESRDVVGSLQYVKAREDTRDMTVGLFSRCCGGNATMIAMTRHPEYFEDIRCMVCPQPVSVRPFVERVAEILGITDRVDDIARELQLVTSFRIDEMSPISYAKNVHVPTLISQVRKDVLTRESDVQTIYDNIPAQDKKLLWIEGTTRRWDGYNYFPNNPEQMLEWFNKYMG